MRNAIYMLAAVLFIASCEKKETHRIYKNGRVIEMDGPMPKPEVEKPTPPADGKYPKMEFAQKEFDFGDIAQNKKVTHTFEFTNTGEADLLISNAIGSCGCTVPNYPKEAIAPGESGKIEVTFNPAGKNGLQNKSITLSTNTEKGKERLQIKANIAATK